MSNSRSARRELKRNIKKATVEAARTGSVAVNLLTQVKLRHRLRLAIAILFKDGQFVSAAFERFAMAVKTGLIK